MRADVECQAGAAIADARKVPRRYQHVHHLRYGGGFAGTKYAFDEWGYGETTEYVGFCSLFSFAPRQLFFTTNGMRNRRNFISTRSIWEGSLLRFSASG